MAPGVDRNPYPQLTELRFLLKVLMIFRIATVTLILGVTIIVQLKGSQALFFAPLYTVYLLIITVYLLTIFLASVFNQVDDFRRMAVGQIAVDLAEASRTKDPRPTLAHIEATALLAKIARQSGQRDRAAELYRFRKESLSLFSAVSEQTCQSCL